MRGLQRYACMLAEMFYSNVRYAFKGLIAEYRKRGGGRGVLEDEGDEGEAKEINKEGKSHWYFLTFVTARKGKGVEVGQRQFIEFTSAYLQFTQL
jgi:hypothetical protein